MNYWNASVRGLLSGPNVSESSLLVNPFGWVLNQFFVRWRMKLKLFLLPFPQIHIMPDEWWCSAHMVDMLACWPARHWCCCYNKSQLFTKQCFTSFPSFVCLSLPLAIRINSRTCFMSFIFTCTHLSLYLTSISPPQSSSVAAAEGEKKKKTRLNSKLKSRSSVSRSLTAGRLTS